MVTPLVKKLGIKEGMNILVLNSPVQYASIVEGIPRKVIMRQPEKGLEVEFVHLFCMTYKELIRDFHNGKSYLKRNGLFWISWPKQSSGFKSDLSRDSIRTYVLSEGLVDVKICSINETWSGLKFVYRLKNR